MYKIYAHTHTFMYKHISRREYGIRARAAPAFSRPKREERRAAPVLFRISKLP